MQVAVKRTIILDLVPGRCDCSFQELETTGDGVTFCWRCKRLNRAPEVLICGHLIPPQDCLVHRDFAPGDVVVARSDGAFGTVMAVGVGIAVKLHGRGDGWWTFSRDRLELRSEPNRTGFKPGDVLKFKTIQSPPVTFLRGVGDQAVVRCRTGHAASYHCSDLEVAGQNTTG